MMNDAPIEVEIVCPECGGDGGFRVCCRRAGSECCGDPDAIPCERCENGRCKATLVPGSLDETAMRYARAYREYRLEVQGGRSIAVGIALQEARTAILSHPGAGLTLPVRRASC